MNTVGASFGFSIVAPSYIGTVRATLAPFKNLFFEIGMDIGGGGGQGGSYNIHDDYKYFSLYPYTNFSMFVPFAHSAEKKRNGWYLGTGVGGMFAKYTWEDVGSIWESTVAMNLVTGFSIAEIIDISFTFRTDFRRAKNLTEGPNGKLSLGYTYRFK